MMTDRHFSRLVSSTLDDSPVREEREGGREEGGEGERERGEEKRKEERNFV